MATFGSRIIQKIKSEKLNHQCSKRQRIIQNHFSPNKVSAIIKIILSLLPGHDQFTGTGIYSGKKLMLAKTLKLIEDSNDYSKKEFLIKIRDLCKKSSAKCASAK